jgi:VanZ family protein
MGILILTGLPGQMIPQVPGFLDLFEADKIIHLVLFGGFMILLYRGFRKEPGWKNQKALVFAILIALALGGLTEVLQKLTIINREGSIWDFIANAAGVGIGIIISSRSRGFFISQQKQ